MRRLKLAVFSLFLIHFLILLDSFNILMIFLSISRRLLEVLNMILVCKYLELDFVTKTKMNGTGMRV